MTNSDKAFVAVALILWAAAIIRLAVGLTVVQNRVFILEKQVLELKEKLK